MAYIIPGVVYINNKINDDFDELDNYCSHEFEPMPLECPFYQCKKCGKTIRKRAEKEQSIQ